MNSGLQAKFRILENISATMNLAASQHLSDDNDGDSNKWDFSFFAVV